MPRPERDRLGRFFPALLILTLLAGALEAAAAIVLDERAFATAAISTAFFALGVLFAGYQIQLGRPARARAALAVSLTMFGGIGAYLIPGVAQAMALLPVVSVILVLPHVQRRQVILVSAAAVGASIVILVLNSEANQLPAIPGIAGIIFQDAILIGVLLLVLVGLADFAMEARDSLQDLGESTERHLQVTTARLSIAAALGTLRTMGTPEATAASIATALADLPLVDAAVILEAGESGLSVLAVAGRRNYPIHPRENLPEARSTYLLARSREGAWAELRADRSWPTLNDGPLTDFAIEGQAVAPIMFGDVIVGLISIITSDPERATQLVADLPSVSEAAAVAGGILAPALTARRQMGSARVRIAEVIASRAFHPVFQPIVDLRTGATVGFEALSRFTSGDPPDLVFAEAVRAGLGSDLEAVTLDAAVRDAARLPRDAWLSLNVSPTFLGERARLRRILAHRTRPITLEITEHEIIDDYEKLHSAMRALGPDVRLAVDDAGAGVANFHHLVDLRPDVVKIDLGLIRGCEADVSRQALIVGLVHFAEVSGALVLAEGLETAAETETVQRLGVTLGQGFHLARPGPIERWVELATPARHLDSTQPRFGALPPTRATVSTPA
jgi:EAL domain-containing protein (putative c-di-GMP-specific phosphodiesterase class I)